MTRVSGSSRGPFPVAAAHDESHLTGRENLTAARFDGPRRTGFAVIQPTWDAFSKWSKNGRFGTKTSAVLMSAPPVLMLRSVAPIFQLPAHSMSCMFE